MASAKDGYPHIVNIFTEELKVLDRSPDAQAERDERWRELTAVLDDGLVARRFHPGQFYRLKAPRGEGRADDHFDDRRREAIHFVDARDEAVVDHRGQLAPALIALGLSVRGTIQRLQLFGKDVDDVRVAVLRRSHGLDDVAGVLGMVVAVERDQLLAPRRMLIGD